MKGRAPFLFVSGLLLAVMWASASSVSDEGQDQVADLKLKRLDTKLDELLAVQDSTLARFEEIMEELRIVKVRVSR